jgi:hypothetical protein
MSVLYKGAYTFGELTPSDDISELKWFPIEEIKITFESIMVEEHIYLMAKLLASLSKTI